MIVGIDGLRSISHTNVAVKRFCGPIFQRRINRDTTRRADRERMCSDDYGIDYRIYLVVCQAFFPLMMCRQKDHSDVS